jgi:2,3-bisphosphoglycerate-dependent phosphoglycerate mutase
VKKLVLLRHGESQWNLENKFTGWIDIDLSKNGIMEAEAASKLLITNNFTFDIAYTSLLKRANRTLDICLNNMKLKDLEIIYDWRLNERHYGALQGLNKEKTAEKYGNEQVKIWRRSFDVPPPSLNLNNKMHPRFEKIYNNFDSKLLPSSESLKDTIKRFIPLWKESICLNIKLNKKVLIVAHGNSLRALVKYLDNLSQEEVISLNIPTGVPLVYELDDHLNPKKHYYLGDKTVIDKKLELIKSQGKS